MLYITTKPILGLLSDGVKRFKLNSLIVRCEKDQNYLLNKLEELEGINLIFQKENLLNLKERGEKITKNLSENNNLRDERRGLFR